MAASSGVRNVSCSAAWYQSIDLPVTLQDEMEMESSMHVTGLVAVQCEARYGFISPAPNVTGEFDGLKPVAYAQTTTDTASSGFMSSPSYGEAKALAACLATPSEATENETARGRLVATNGAIRGTIVYQFQEEVTQCVDRWGEWVRRIRRKRRHDHIQAVVSMLSRAAATAATVK